MKRILTILCLLVCLVASIALPLIFSSEVGSRTLGTIGSLVSAVASLITLGFAFLLFSRYGLEKRIVDRQFDAIEALLTSLKDTSIVLHCSNGAVFVRPLGRAPSLSFDAEMMKRRIGVSFDLLHVLERIGIHGADVYMPPPIANALISFQVAVVETNKGFDPSSPSLLRYGDSEPIGDTINGAEFTLSDLTTAFKDVLDAVNLWFDAHSDTKVRLNLPPLPK